MCPKTKIILKAQSRRKDLEGARRGGTAQSDVVDVILKVGEVTVAARPYKTQIYLRQATSSSLQRCCSAKTPGSRSVLDVQLQGNVASHENTAERSSEACSGGLAPIGAGGNSIISSGRVKRKDGGWGGGKRKETNQPH